MDEKELLRIIKEAAESDCTELDLRRKQIKTLPPEIGMLSNLTHLDLSDNQLTGLPPQIFELSNLTELNLRGNRLTELPPQIFELSNLTQLGLAGIGLTNLPPGIAALSNLTQLDLYDNELIGLPPQIFELSNLTELDLMDNKLTSLPPQIFELSNLTHLDLSYNQLTSLPPQIFELSNLTQLGLAGIGLTNLPPEIAALSNLTQLDLRGNSLTSLPPEIGMLRDLTQLELSFNGLTELPPQIFELSNLTQLNLIGNKLTSLPPGIAALSNLTQLGLAGIGLTNLPPEIGQLRSLTRLDLRGNSLTELPPEIAALRNLTVLHLGGNSLTSLPPQIFELNNLTQLNLDYIGLTNLPPEIGQLCNLTHLDLRNNQLTGLPPEIAALRNLTRLDLRENSLTGLSPEIAALRNLTHLDLRNNQLTSLPPEIVRLKNLEKLDIDQNPFSAYPPEIVAQGSAAILTYLRELERGSRPQWVSKLVLVGEGGVGKTCLLRALRGEEFIDSPTTRGIEIHPLELAHPERSDVHMTLNAWDFGGQEIYHATHQFFLTNRSLFVLVWNARHGYEQGKLYYWLDAIQARAPDSPVLVVAAWCDERQPDLPKADLQRQYPQVAGFYSVSNKCGDGVDQLRQAISQIAAQLPLMGETWPENWLQAAAAVRRHAAQYVTPQEFYSLMEQHQVSKTGQRVLARWLHELGDILYFREDAELSDVIILKPQWVNHYISRVLDSPEVEQRAGVFTDEHMKKLWRDLSPAMQQHFLRLMEKFDLSYRTMENQEVSLIVELLPQDPPDYQTLWQKNTELPGQHEICMKYTFNAVMPGLPTWFMARSHRFSTHTHWRYGALFAYESEQRHLALVQVFPHERCLQLTVRGPSPYNFFALLKDGIELTLERYPGLKIRRTMPCPGHDGAACDYEFDYENLQRALERVPPVEFVQCQRAFENVSVPQLLLGLHWRTQDIVLKKLEEVGQKIELKIEGKSDVMLDKMDYHHDDITLRLEQLEQQQDELLTLAQREFAKQFRLEQSKIESCCPNLFVLRPHAAQSWKKLLQGEKLELQLYCQQPGCWHPSGQNGLYIFDYPPGWLRAAGRYLQNMVGLLKFVTPLMGPWLGMQAAGYASLIENDLKFMQELVKMIPDIVESEEIKLAEHLKREPDFEKFEAVEGAPLRAVRLLLEKLDKQQVWGGLTQVLTPEGHYLWLCDYHAQHYKEEVQRKV